MLRVHSELYEEKYGVWNEGGQTPFSFSQNMRRVLCRILVSHLETDIDKAYLEEVN